MTETVSSLGHRLSERLKEAVAAHGVPGAGLGVTIGDESVVVGAGVANLHTRAPVTADSIFAIGSVTKIYQAALLLSLGLELDDPVRRHLPEFHCADAAASDAITVRDLLTHSSGLAGDYFPDFGWGDDAVRLFVQSCATLGLDHPPGLLTSYCNTGVNVGGRLLEVQAGSSWDHVLNERLLKPARLTRTISLPWEAIVREIAIGHVPTPNGLAVAPSWSWPRATSPCGGTLAASAGDVLQFADLHLSDSPVIDSEIVEAMQEYQRPWPSGIRSADGASLQGIGLGWFIFDWSGTRVLGHDGSGLGCSAILRVVPEHETAVVCLANAWYAGYGLSAEVVGDVLREELGLSSPEPEPAENPHPSSRYVGAYERLGTRFVVTLRENGRLGLTYTHDAMFVSPASTADLELAPVGPDLFRSKHPLTAVETTYRFVETSGTGLCDYIYDGIRASRRVSTGGQESRE